MYLNPKVEMNSLKGNRGVAEPDSNSYRLCVNSLGGLAAKTEGRNAVYRHWRATIQKGIFLSVVKSHPKFRKLLMAAKVF